MDIASGYQLGLFDGDGGGGQYDDKDSDDELVETIMSLDQFDELLPGFSSDTRVATPSKEEQEEELNREKWKRVNQKADAIEMRNKAFGTAVISKKLSFIGLDVATRLRRRKAAEAKAAAAAAATAATSAAAAVAHCAK